MIRRFASLLLLAWLFGFLAFALALPQPRDGGRTDGIVVLTGGAGRIPRALAALDAGWASRVLVSGVDRQVTPAEFAAEYRIAPATLRCCVTLGFDSFDTRSNAEETVNWLSRTKARSIRLVTSDWHMRRAALELRRELPENIAIVRDAVPSQPSFRILFLEYHKLLASYAIGLSAG